MRKLWPVFILATVVGVPAAVEANNHGSGSGQKGSSQANHPAVHHSGNHHGSHQGNMAGVSVNVNVRVNVGSVTPFGSPRASRPPNLSTPKSHTNASTKPPVPKSSGTFTTKPPATNSQTNVNVYTGVTINLKEYVLGWHHHHHHKDEYRPGLQNSNNSKTPSTNGSTPGVAYSPGTGSMSSGYPSSGTTNTGTGGNSSTGSVASNNSGPGTINTGTEEEEEPVVPSTTKTNDISVEENAGFFNVRGGAANLKLVGKQPNRQPNQGSDIVNASFVSAEGTEPVQHQATAKQERVVEQPEYGSPSITPSTQDTIGQPQPEKGTGLPVVPSLAGLLTFGAMAVVGWKKIR